MRMTTVKPFTKVKDTRSQYVRLDTLASDGGKVCKHRLMWSDGISGQTVTEDYHADALESALKSFNDAVINL